MEGKASLNSFTAIRTENEKDILVIGHPACNYTPPLEIYCLRVKDSLSCLDHLYLGGHEDTNRDDDFRVEFLCPLCGEDYDILGLFCHIDEEHPGEAKNRKNILNCLPQLSVLWTWNPLKSAALSF